MSVSFRKSSTQVEEQADSPFRSVYQIPRVNLLPQEIEDERRFRRIQIGLGAATLAVAAVVVGGFVLAAASASSAEDDLAAETARTSALQAEQAEYAEVPLVLGQVEAARNAQSTTMVTDVLWYQYLNRFAATYPSNLWLSDLTISLTDAATAGTAVDPIATPGIGNIIFTGTGKEHPDTAAWLDVLGETPGLADPYYSTTSRGEIEGQVVVDSSVSVVITPDALSHRFDRKAS